MENSNSQSAARVALAALEALRMEVQTEIGREVLALDMSSAFDVWTIWVKQGDERVCFTWWMRKESAMTAYARWLDYQADAKTCNKEH